MKKLIDWFHNYWYHYKWPVIIISFFVIVFIVGYVQIFTTDDYDLFVMYAGPENIDATEHNDIVSSLGNIMEDNEDGSRPLANIQAVTYVPSELATIYMESGLYYNAATNNEASTTFSNSLMNGQYVVLLLTPELYETAKGQGALKPLFDVLGYTPDGAIDEYGITLSETAFAKDCPGLIGLPVDTVLCCRSFSQIKSLFLKSKHKAEYDYQLEVFKSIVEYYSK